ncbi:hypothetical protein ES705_18429 [subsurface metagenome]
MLNYIKKLSVYLIIIFILFFLGNSLIMSANNQEESSFIIRILNSEIRDQNSYLKIEKIGKHLGTGFFVSFENELYVVTARHVADQKYDLIGVARIKNNETGEIEKYKLFLPKNDWVYHPDNGNIQTCPVDIAVMRVDGLNNYEIFSLNSDSDFLNKNYIEELPYKDFSEEIYICRSYNWISDFKIKEFMSHDPTRPILTFIINEPKKKIFQQKYLKNKRKCQTFNKFFEDEILYLKGNMFPGNSGSPVIDVTPFENPKKKLLGIHVASEMIRVENNIIPLLVVAIEPSYRIIETLEYAKNQHRNKKNSTTWSPLNF